MFLTACGEASQEKVLKKLDKAWTSEKGYEIEATMEMNIGAEMKKYAIEVWHSEPEFYRVKVSDEANESQLILRNEEGVFVVTPSTNKSYKFQSDWPHKNSQAYLLEGLLQQIKGDSEAKMSKKDDEYIFVVNLTEDKSGLQTARIQIDEKTLKPQVVTLFNAEEQEQVVIKFAETKYSSKRSAEDYALEKYSENKDNSQQTETSGAETSDTETSDTETSGTETDSKDTSSTEQTTYYPIIDWAEVKLSDEQTIQQDGVTRTVLSYTGEKSFTLLQQPVEASNELLPVFAPGDPAHVGAVIGAMTDTSLSWQQDGKEFFIASSTLTMDEMLEVAGSLVEGSMK